MGLFTRLVMLPLAPVEGVVWVAEQLRAQAEQQFYSPESIQAQLGSLHEDLEEGRISQEEYVQVEDELLDRLDEARAREEARLNGSQP
jgi:Gas vesicle protein G